MSWPRRTGLVTAHKLAKGLKTILLKYHDLLETILTEADMTKIDNLISCCELFITDVPQYEP